MRIYSASSEETLHARKLLADWVGDGLLTKAQYERLEKETVSDLRTTNIFLRVILFVFTLICIGAATALFFTVFLSHSPDRTTGIFLLLFAAGCYAGAEVAATQARLYRYGIEEAFAACSVGFLCVGMLLAFFSGAPYSLRPKPAESLIFIAGAIFSLWIWHRFGLGYAFLAAMVFALFLPGYWKIGRAHV